VPEVGLEPTLRRT